MAPSLPFTLVLPHHTSSLCKAWLLFLLLVAPTSHANSHLEPLESCTASTHLPGYCVLPVSDDRKETVSPERSKPLLPTLLFPIEQGFPTSRIECLKMSWCNNNRKKMRHKCNGLESSPNHSLLPWSMEQLSSMKMAKFGDHCHTEQGISCPPTDRRVRGRLTDSCRLCEVTRKTGGQMRKCPGNSFLFCAEPPVWADAHTRSQHSLCVCVCGGCC